MSRGYSRSQPHALVLLLACLSACGESVSEPEGEGVPTDWSAAQAWTTFQGDASHRGHVPATLDVRNFSEVWTSAVTTIELAPAVHESGVLIVSSNGNPHQVEAKVAGIDLASGAELWSREFPGWDVDDFALYGGRLYFRGGQEVWSLDARSGDSIWAIDVTRHHNYRAPIVVGDQLLLAGGADSYRWGGLLSLDPSTGVENWFQPFVEEGGWSPTLVGNTVLVPPGGMTGGLVGRDVATGDSLFEVPDPGFGAQDEGGTPAAARSDRIVLVQDERLVVFDPDLRQTLWERTNRYRQQPSVTDSLVYAVRTQVVDGVQTDTLHVFDVDDGTLLWGLSLPEGRANRPLLSTRNFVFVATELWTYAVDLTERAIVWQVRHSGHLTITQDGLLIISGQDGVVRAVDLG